MFFLYRRDYEINLNYQFSGIVERVRYEVKGKPYVTLKDKIYYLSFNDWNFNYEIEKGDSLIKRKGEMTIKLIKPNGKVLTY